MRKATLNLTKVVVWSRAADYSVLEPTMSQWTCRTNLHIVGCQHKKLSQLLLRTMSSGLLYQELGTEYCVDNTLTIHRHT